MTDDTLSAEDKLFLKQCEEEFKDRYTEKDEDFMAVFNAEPSIPPIVESWWVPQNAGRRDRRTNRRPHPYDRRDGHRDRNYHDRRDNYDRRDHDRRVYNDYNRGDRDRADSSYGYRNRRSRY